jgi:hypothetical protein
MTALNLFDWIASLASIVSLAFAAFVYHRDKLRETKEQANVEMLKTRLGTIANNLSVTSAYLQTLIRQADDDQTPVRELQNMARGVRAGVLGTLMDARSMEATVSEWKIGHLLKSRAVALEQESEPLDDSDREPPSSPNGAD